MDSNQILRKMALGLALVGLSLGLGLTPSALAQDKAAYNQLLVLLPGEVAAPGTGTGKIGLPSPQQAGVPFRVQVLACDSDWNLVEAITNPLHLSSSDGTANLPPNTPLHQGSLRTWVTLNTLGSFTLTAQDLASGQQVTGESLPVLVEATPTYSDQLVVTSIPREQTAGEPVLVRIEARRADGSLDVERNGTLTLNQVTSLGQGLVEPGTIEMVAGVWEGLITFFLAEPENTPDGSTRLNVSFGEDGLQGWSNTFHVEAGPYDRLVLITPGQNWTPWIIGGINGDPERQWADGLFPVDVYATDRFWNRVDVTDYIQVDSGDSEGNTPRWGPLIGGHRRFEVNLLTPGPAFLAVSDMDQPEIGGMVTPEIPVWYSHLQILLPGEEAAPGTETGRIGSPLPQVAGIPFPVKIRACNANFEPVPTNRVLPRLTSTDYSATLPAPQPLQNGELVTEIIFNSSGTFTLTAEDITGPEFYVTTTDPVAVTGSTGIVTELVMDHIGAFQTAGQPTPVIIQARDNDGNRVTTFSGTLDLAQWVGSVPGSLEPSQVVMSHGQWSGGVTFHVADQSTPDGQPGNVTLKASLSTDPTLTITSNHFQVGPGSLAHMLILLPGQTSQPASIQGFQGSAATQAAGQPFSVEVRTVDSYWNQVPVTHSVQINSEDPAGSTPVQAILDEGSAMVPVTLGSTGNWTLTVQDLTQDWVTPMTTVPISVLGSTPDFVIETVEGPVMAGAPTLVTIHTHTPEGQLMEDFNGFAMLAAETGPQTVSPATIQFTDGVWSGMVTFFGADPEMTFSCVDFASPPNLGTSNTFEVLPGEFAGLQVLLPGQENVRGRDPGFAGEPTEQEAGQEFAVLIQAVDSWWNPVPGIETEIDLDLTDPFALFAENTRLADGQLVLGTTLLRAGEHTISASCDSATVNTYTSSIVAVRPGPYARLLALAPGEEILSGSELGKVGLALDQSISYAFALRVLATDPWWNPVTGVDDMIELVCTDTVADLPATFSLSDGAAEIEIRLGTAGYQLMTFNNLSNSSIPAAHTQMRAIESGFHIEAEIHPEQVVAGQPFTLSVRVVNDAGAVMQDINGFAQVAVINAVTTEPGEGELLAGSFQFQQGVRSINQTYTRSEPIILVISTPMGQAPGMTGVLEVVPGEPASLDFHETSEWVAGRHTTDINAKVSDELGNGVPGVEVAFDLTGGLGFMEVINNVTDTEGLARARFTGASQAGAGIIQAAASGFIVSMEIMTSLLDPTSRAGTISNYPNPFHPGDGGTSLTYMLEQEATVNMRLFTLTGTLVFERVYAAGEQGGAAGINEVNWDGRNGEGDYVASGGYILYVEAVSQGETIHKMRRRIGVVR